MIEAQTAASHTGTESQRQGLLMWLLLLEISQKHVCGDAALGATTFSRSPNAQHLSLKDLGWRQVDGRACMALMAPMAKPSKADLSNMAGSYTEVVLFIRNPAIPIKSAAHVVGWNLCVSPSPG